MKTEEAVEQSEIQLTLANFASAENLSKSALGSLRADNEEERQALSRALHVCVQSLYQQRRIGECREVLLKAYNSLDKIDPEVFLTWICLEVDSSRATEAAEALKEYITAQRGSQSQEKGTAVSNEEYTTLCRLLIVEVLCKELDDPSAARAFLGKVSEHLPAPILDELATEIRRVPASSSSQQAQNPPVTAERPATPEEPVPTSGSAPASHSQSQGQQSPEEGEAHLGEERGQEAGSGEGGEIKRGGEDSAVPREASDETKSGWLQRTFGGMSSYVDSFWHKGDDSGAVGTAQLQTVGLVAGACLLTYAAFAERQVISRKARDAAVGLRRAYENFSALALSFNPNPMAAVQKGA